MTARSIVANSALALTVEVHNLSTKQQVQMYAWLCPYGNFYYPRVPAGESKVFELDGNARCYHTNVPHVVEAEENITHAHAARFSKRSISEDEITIICSETKTDPDAVLCKFK